VTYAAANSSIFRCALKVAMVAELFVTGDRERVPDSWCHDEKYSGWKLILVTG